jgi:hypothetical protein
VPPAVFSTVLAAAALALLAADAGAQPKTETGRVVLANVTDSAGQPLVDVGPDDFVISENGVERDIVNVYPADYPIVLLLDNGIDARSDLADIRAAAARFIGRVGERALALGTLAHPPRIVASFGEERAALLGKLEQLTTSPTTGLVPVQAVSNAAHEVLRAGTPFGAIVVVTGRPIDATQPEAPSLLRDILDSHALVHVITRRSPGTAPRGRGYPARLEGDVLHDLADQTRGEYTPVFSAASYGFALDRLADRMAAEMMIEYIVPDRSPVKGDVRVGVRIPGARVRGLGVR